MESSGYSLHIAGGAPARFYNVHVIIPELEIVIKNIQVSDDVADVPFYNTILGMNVIAKGNFSIIHTKDYASFKFELTDLTDCAKLRDMLKSSSENAINTPVK